MSVLNPEACYFGVVSVGGVPMTVMTNMCTMSKFFRPVELTLILNQTVC